MIKLTKIFREIDPTTMQVVTFGKFVLTVGTTSTEINIDIDQTQAMIEHILYRELSDLKILVRDITKTITKVALKD